MADNIFWDWKRNNRNIKGRHSTTIGENIKIGAGSVIIKDIPPNSIAAGNPARIIKPKEI